MVSTLCVVWSNKSFLQVGTSLSLLGVINWNMKDRVLYNGSSELNDGLKKIHFSFVLSTGLITQSIVGPKVLSISSIFGFQTNCSDNGC